MRSLRVAAAAVLIAAVALACNAISGVGDLEASGLDEDGGVPDQLDGARPDGTSALVDGQGPPAIDGSVGPSDASSCAAGGTCVPQAPVGWSGPYAMLTSDGAVSASAQCPSPDRFERFGGAPSRSLTCPACTCQAPAGGSCTATLTTYADTTCGDPSTELAVVDATMCTVNNNGWTAGAMFRHAVKSKGKCTAALGGPPVRGTVVWPKTYLFCGSSTPTSTGCGALAERCLPPAPGAKACILKEGAEACPAPWTAKATVYSDVADPRQCDVTGCHCSDPNGVSCQAAYRSFGTSTCTPLFPGGGTARTADACFAFDPIFSATATTAPAAVGGSCAPSGTPGQTGVISPTGEATACCLP